VILTVVTRDEPWVPVAERIKVKHFGEQIYRAKIYFGFNEVADVPEALSLAAAKGLSLSIPETSFFLARESLVPSSRSGMAKWRERLFIFLARNAENAMTFWRIPPDRVIEFGVMVDL
jgi:KUP system potassium uptake protein